MILINRKIILKLSEQVFIISAKMGSEAKKAVSTLRSHKIRTFVFLDLETTGLPFYENNLTRITEICGVAVEAAHLELGVFPRVQNTLSFCLNPNKIIKEEVTKITGLSNELLEDQPRFSSGIELFKKWLEMYRSPLCIVAHNGNKFDFPILKAEMSKSGVSLPGDILSLDSLEVFQSLDALQTRIMENNVSNKGEEEEIEAHSTVTAVNLQKINETTPKKQIMSSGFVPNQKNMQSSKSHHRNTFQSNFKSFKLSEIYRRLVFKEPVDAHQALADVQMLITCAATYAEKFVDFANLNAKPLDDVPKMVPGKKIGT